MTSALDWEAIRWAKGNGFNEFDLGGLSGEATSTIIAEGFNAPALDGPSRFKVGFGGRLHQYPPAVELISSKLVRSAYDALGSASFGQVLVDRVRRWMRQGPTKLSTSSPPGTSRARISFVAG